MYCRNNPLKYIDPSGLISITLPLPWQITIPIPALPNTITPPFLPTLIIDQSSNWSEHPEITDQEGETKELLKEMQSQPPGDPDYEPVQGKNYIWMLVVLLIVK